MIFNFLDNRHIKKYCQSSSFNYHPLSLISCALTFTETKCIINILIRKGEKNQTNHFEKTSYFHLSSRHRSTSWILPTSSSTLNILNIFNIINKILNIVNNFNYYQHLDEDLFVEWIWVTALSLNARVCSSFNFLRLSFAQSLCTESVHLNY